MQIDWITVSAQIVNFLVLVYLLKRFLYQPVITAMEQRQQRIANRLQKAEQREQEAGQEAQHYREKAQNLEQQRDELIAKAKEEAEAQRQHLLNEAREEVATARKEWLQQVEREKQEFLKALKKQTGETMVKTTRAALADLADTTLEQQMVGIFLTRLESLDEADRQALKETPGALRITTSFELSQNLRDKVTEAVHEHLMPHTDIHYTQSPELLCGIELNTEGRKISWTLAEYLDALENQMTTVLDSAKPSTG
ncbi:F0F1 ATP synthase subunit B [Nitrosococcus wardiae]|uniref:ATP synthase subunit b n=1 Tax=Nitrosococcus wardiae TaxID=1814290 RepID=A0A4P7C168_9GAMM|nr:F0F1 ATP synthase subunit B [Nitrosococcus wardiae]QBQ55320.1 F0F1 ATP synthase subunit B [Nitrosococcus wardiae]